MHWIADAAGLASSGSVSPVTWTMSTRMSVVVGVSLWSGTGSDVGNARKRTGAGRRSIVAIPASAAARPERMGLYIAIVADMNLLLAEWNCAGRIGDAIVAAAVVPVWSRDIDQFPPSRRAAGPLPASSSRASSFSS